MFVAPLLTDSPLLRRGSKKGNLFTRFSICTPISPGHWFLAFLSFFFAIYSQLRMPFLRYILQLDAKVKFQKVYLQLQLPSTVFDENNSRYSGYPTFGENIKWSERCRNTKNNRKMVTRERTALSNLVKRIRE